MGRNSANFQKNPMKAVRGIVDTRLGMHIHLCMLACTHTHTCKQRWTGEEPFQSLFTYKVKHIPVYLDTLLLALTTLVTLRADFADDKLMIFFLFFLEIGSDTSCKLPPNETTYMKCQILFSRKNTKNKILKCHLLKLLPSMQVLRVLKLQKSHQEL